VLAAAPAKTAQAGSAKVTMSVAGNGKQIFHADGVSRLDRDQTRLHLTYDVRIGAVDPGTQIEGVLRGDDTYIKLPTSKHWIHTGADGEAFSTGVAESLDYLGAVTGNAKAEGGDTVRGVPVRTYSATVDLERVADNLPPVERDDYRRKRVEKGLPARLPLKVAIDEQGRIALMDYRSKIQGVDVQLHFELFDFGAKADFSVPKDVVEG
jgi:hypothetical protein